MEKESIRRMAFIILVAIFVLYNIIWTIYVSNTYGPYNEKLGFASMSSNSVIREKDYTFAVKMPSWLRFVGNLSIAQNLHIYEDGSCDDSIAMLIWPKGRNKFQIGISIDYSVFDKKENSFVTDSVSFYVDEQMNLIDTSDSEINEIYEQHYKIIEEVFKLAYEKWGILPQYEKWEIYE